MSKPISDIRLYTSRRPNADGYPLPDAFGSKALALRLRRIAMKLRELGFSLGDFDHLYINLTACLPEGEVRPAQRSVHRELSWLRYVDVGVRDTLPGHADSTAIIPLAERCLALFSHSDTDLQLIRTAIAESEKGEGMLMRFKTKQAGKLTAVIYLRLLDSGQYHPLLCACDADGTEVLRADLPPCTELHALGEIRISRKAVTIVPRRNSFAQHLAPLVFPLR